jgi:hypothetical protein
MLQALIPVRSAGRLTRRIWILPTSGFVQPGRQVRHEGHRPVGSQRRRNRRDPYRRAAGGSTFRLAGRLPRACRACRALLDPNVICACGSAWKCWPARRRAERQNIRVSRSWTVRSVSTCQAVALFLSSPPARGRAVRQPADNLLDTIPLEIHLSQTWPGCSFPRSPAG